MPDQRKRRQKVGLADMPEVVMKNILEKANFQSILKLRKVSRDLRNFIDDEKPEFHLEIIGIHMTSEQIKIFLKSSENKAPHIEYQKHEQGCQIVCSRRAKSKTYLLENEHFVEVFCREFEQVMSHQKTSVLLSFSLTAPKIPEEFKRVLMAKPTPIKTQIFSMTTKTHSQVMDVLPHMDPKYLKELCFYSSPTSPRLEKWIFDGIVESDQWKTAHMLEVVQFFVDVPLKNFHHFSAGNYFVNAVTAEELFELKENYLSSNPLKRVFIGYLDEEPLKDQELHALFGKPYFANPRQKVDRGRWYFRIAGTDKAVHFVLYFAKSLQFSLINLSEVPSNAELR